MRFFSCYRILNITKFSFLSSKIWKKSAWKVIEKCTWWTWLNFSGWAFILLKCRHGLVTWGENLKPCMYVTHWTLHATWLVDTCSFFYLYREREIEKSKHKRLFEIFLYWHDKFYLFMCNGFNSKKFIL